MASKVRLYVDHPLSQGQPVPLDRAQANYLFAVMRLEADAVVSLINGRDGEWDARIATGNKRGGILECVTQTQAMRHPPDLWLVFAPIKKARTDFIVEKAVELGVARLVPVQTDFTNERMRADKLQAHAVEAAEQCGGLYVPPVDDLTKLDALLDGWDDRQILFCDEAMVGQALDLTTLAPGPWAVFIGPEGGFSDRERDRLRCLACAHAISLGPRILRADTATVAALTLWQSHLGDWT